MSSQFSARRPPVWSYVGLVCFVLSATIFDIYHVRHLIKYRAGEVGAVREPILVDPTTTRIVRVREEAARAGVQAGDTLVGANGQPFVGTRVLDGPVITGRPNTAIDLTV